MLLWGLAIFLCKDSALEGQPGGGPLTEDRLSQAWHCGHLGPVPVWGRAVPGTVGRIVIPGLYPLDDGSSPTPSYGTQKCLQTSPGVLWGQNSSGEFTWGIPESSAQPWPQSLC